MLNSLELNIFSAFYVFEVYNFSYLNLVSVVEQFNCGSKFKSQLAEEKYIYSHDPHAEVLLKACLVLQVLVIA